MSSKNFINTNFLNYLKKNFTFINIYIIDNDFYIVVPYKFLFNFITFLKRLFSSFLRYRSFKLAFTFGNFFKKANYVKGFIDIIICFCGFFTNFD